MVDAWAVQEPLQDPAACDAPVMVRPEFIRRDGGTQMRAALDVATVHEYHDLIRDAGGAWPFRDPVRLVHDGSDHWLVDGFHRLQAWTMHYGDPAPAVPAIVVSGDQRAAVLAWPMVKRVFPVGQQLRVWLDTGCPLAEFQARLRTLDPELNAQPLQPTLQDAALRELAMTESIAK